MQILYLILDRIEKVYQKNRRYLRILFYKCLYFRREHGFFQKKKTFFVRLQQKKFLTGTQFPVFHTKVLHIAPEILPDVRIGNHAQYQTGIRFLHTGAGCLIDDLLRKNKGKFTSFFIFALYPDIAVHQIQKLLGNRKAETRSFDIAVPLAVKLLKRPEQLMAVLFFNADSGIFYRKIQLNISCIYLQIIHFYCNLSGIGKFRRIVGDIEQNLLDSDIIPQQLIGQIRRNIEDQFNILSLQSRHNNIGNIADNGHRLIIFHIDIHFTGFDFGKVEDIIDDRQKRLPCFLDLTDIVSGRRRKILAHRHFRHTDDRIHGRTDFMAHICQEIGLHIRGTLHIRRRLMNIIFIARHIG